MKTIRVGDPQPTETPNQFRIDILPPIEQDTSSGGHGRIDITSFDSGLHLLFLETQFNQLTLTREISDKPTIGFGFCVAGQFESRIVTINDPMAIKTGECGYFTYPESVEVFEKIGKGRMNRVYLMLETDFLFQLVKGDENRFLPVLKRLDERSSCRIGDSITPVMKLVLHQMLQCPYQGAMRHTFLEAKAMELLVYKMEQLYPQGHLDHNSSSIKASDAERVRHAADILVNNLENPPNMTALAHTVGLGRSKFYQCFRQVYGLSPFDYLRNHRLQMAGFLLQEGMVNVTEAALSVGFSHLSYFAKSFKSMYGLSPREFLKSSRSLVSKS